ncbi:17224_t:CDS:2, partial [Gigaspora rosea]
QNTLTILPTGAGKTLIFLVSSILSKTLTVVFTPLKAIMENQLVRIPATAIFATLNQPLDIQEKMFSKVVAGQIKEEFPSAPLLLLTATCSHQEASKLVTILNRADLECIEIFNGLKEYIEPHQLAFGKGVHAPYVRIIIHTTFPLSPTNFVQE